MTDVVLVTTDQLTNGAATLVGLAVLAGTVGTLAALLYRGYTRERIPTGLALLFGLSAVAAYLNTTATLTRVLGDNLDPVENALFNIIAFGLAGTTATIGRRVGDHFGEEVILGDARENIDNEVSRLVETVGRVIVVELPEEIDDVVGYDPVTGATKEKMAGKRLVFPKNLTVSQLEDRLVGRLKADYGVGTVDIELDDDGTVEYLAVGSRAAGIGPTLPPATNAVAIRADPAFSASTGDLVQVWETAPPKRVLTGELRGVAEDVVTVAISASDTPKIDPTRQYRLVTLPVDDRPEREFASLLRAADETFTSVSVEAGSPLHGMPVGALDLTVLTVKPESGDPIPLPERTYVLEPGELIFVIALPEALRHLETAGKALDPSVVSESSVPTDTETGDTLDESGPIIDTGETDPASDTSTPADGETPPPETADEPTDRSPAQSGSPATADVRADIEMDFDEDESEDGAFEQPEQATATDDTEDIAVETKADESTFDELKSEFESGGLDDEEDSTDDDTIESLADDGSPSADETESSGGTTSFDDLKSEYESGDAEWDDENESVDEAATFDETDDGESNPSHDDSPDDLVSLEDADISLDESDDESDADDDLSALSLEDDDDGTLFDDEVLDEDDGLFDEEDPFDEDGFDDESERADEDESDEEESEDDEDDEDDGGGTSFAQLKEEFEDGDADWADDISDSPGGDMRLDE